MSDHSFASFAAQKTWGASQKIINSTALEVGVANRGVFLHRLSSGKELIEKRTKKVKELEFCQAILSQSLFKGDTFLTIPTIFDIVTKESVYYIFMESLTPLDDSVFGEKKLAPKIGNFISDLHKDFDAICKGQGDMGLYKFGHLDRLLDVFPPKHKREYKMLCDLVEVFKKEKKVFSHNDLKIANMGSRKNKKDSILAFDFGLVGVNTPGAELHCFLDRSPNNFFNSLVDEYCLASGLEKGLVLAGANLYSGYKEFEKSKNIKDINVRFKNLKQSVVLANQAIMI